MCNKLLFVFGTLVILILLSLATIEAFNATTTSRPTFRPTPNYYTDPRTTSQYVKVSSSSAGGGDVSGSTTGGGRSGGRASSSSGPSGGSGSVPSDSRGRRYLQQQQDIEDDEFNDAQGKCLEEYQDCLAGNRFEGRPDDYNDLADDMW